MPFIVVRVTERNRSMDKSWQHRYAVFLWSRVRLPSGAFAAAGLSKAFALSIDRFNAAPGPLCSRR
jgi:hypothetical protein